MSQRPVKRWGVVSSRYGRLVGYWRGWIDPAVCVVRFPPRPMPCGPIDFAMAGVRLPSPPPAVEVKVHHPEEVLVVKKAGDMAHVRGFRWL